MHASHYAQYEHHGNCGCQNPGLVGVFGGILGLSTALLQGSARMARTVVEGTMWYGCHDYCDGPYHHGSSHCGQHGGQHGGRHAYHYYHVDCWPGHSSRCC